MESPELTDYLRFAAALVFVLCLMGGLAFVLRKFGAGALAAPQAVRKRLRIIEVLPFDARRRMVLLQRDDTEHLVILGINGETVVETGIRPPEKPEDPSRK